MQEDMIEIFRKMGNQVILTTYICKNYEEDQEFESNLLEDLENTIYDFVFSFNYFPIISQVCEIKKIKYLSWIFDSPHLNVFSNTAANPCNVIFHFDRCFCNLMKEKGLTNIYHLPLAANVNRLDSICCTSYEKEQYKSSASFVGRLYDKKNFYDQINYLPDYLKGYFSGIMQSQLLIYGYNFLPEVLPDEIMSELTKYVKLSLAKTCSFDERLVFSNLFLSQKVTSMERIQMIHMLSKVMETNLYSDYIGNDLPFVEHMGGVDSYSTAPKVFRNSSINLNISLRSIITGIPLRVFEILGAGGFLITNYQQEFNDYFVPGEDIVIYENAHDLICKAKYYLEHESERLSIATSAHEKMKKYHTFEHRIQTMFEIAGIRGF